MKIEIPAEWPEKLRQYLVNNYSAFAAIETLSGLSLAKVYRLVFEKETLILKVSEKPLESQFYRKIAPILWQNGIATPAPKLALEAKNLYWLLLENIPQPLPRERWLADPEVIGVLHRLHNLAVTESIALPRQYQPYWDQAMNEKALQSFPAGVGQEIAPALERLRENSQGLFEPVCPVSADPNPTNWGLREDGTVVLYDWERFTYGTPAIDLAIIIPGLGDQTSYEKVAAIYLAGSNNFSSVAVGQLARQIGLAKLWTVVEYLGTYQQGQARATAGLQKLLEIIPEWIKTLAGNV